MQLELLNNNNNTIVIIFIDLQATECALCRVVVISLHKRWRIILFINSLLYIDLSLLPIFVL